MKVLMLLCLVGAAMAGTDQTELAIREMVDSWNLWSLCWGEDKLIDYIKEVKKAVNACGLESTNDVGTRRRRQTPTPEEAAAFIMKVGKFQNINKEKYDGVKCALQKLDVLDEAGDIKIDAILESWRKESEDGEDDLFVQMMVNGTKDCYDVSQSWPQTMLDRHPVAKQYGRHIIFFQCQKAAQEKGCYAAMLKNVQDKIAGPLDDVDHEKYGFSSNPYEQAQKAMRIKYETMSPANRHLHEFMWAKARFL